MPDKRLKRVRKSPIRDRILARIRTDRDLNPGGLPPKAFFEDYYERTQGQGISATRSLAHHLSVGEWMVSAVRKGLGCKMYSYSESGSRRGKAIVTRTMVDRASPLSDKRERRNRLMEQARSGDRLAQIRLMREYQVRIYTPAEIRTYVRNSHE